MSILKSILMNCKEATLLSTRQTEETLTWRERLGLRIHLLICKPCLHFSRQIRSIQKTLQSLAESDIISFNEKKKEELQKKVNESL